MIWSFSGYHESGICQITEKFQSEKKILQTVLQTENTIAQTIYQKLCNKNGGKLTLENLRNTLISARQLEINSTNLPESDFQEIEELLKQIDANKDTEIGFRLYLLFLTWS